MLIIVEPIFKLWGIDISGNNGKFVMVGGLDGAGKGVVVNTLKQWAFDQGLGVFDLRDYWVEKDDIPILKDQIIKILQDIDG